MTSIVQKISVATILAYGTAAHGGWEQLAPIPGRLGVAAPFAGVSGHTLLVAGGANFPDKAPWDGGKKVWYDAVYALDAKTGDWIKAGTLPRPLGYGVSATFGNRMICVGGSDAETCYADAFWLDYEKGTVHTTKLPSLPTPIANACAACVGSTLYVAGGQISDESNSVMQSAFSLDLSKEKAEWKTLEPIPGPGRILATAAAFDGSFYVIGGASLSEGKDHAPQRAYLSDVYAYAPGKGWKRLADLPNAIVAAPSPAPVDETGIFILGGDDGSHVGFKPVNLHPGFSKVIWHFDKSTGAWTRAGEMPEARVTVPCVEWADGFVITSGEMRPGVRSPQVWMFHPKDAR